MSSLTRDFSLCKDFFQLPEKPGKHICWLSTNHKQTSLILADWHQGLQDTEAKSRERKIFKFFKYIFIKFKVK